MTLQIYIIIFYAVFKEQTISISQTRCQILNGGDEEIRTPDPLRARQVLSQLSYTPKNGGPSGTRTPDLPVMSRLL